MSLHDIYGAAAGRQVARYESALAAFRDCFGPGETYLFRAPGRVNLIGEHTDYNHGYVLPAALDRDIVLVARPRRDGRVQLHNQEATFAPQQFDCGANIPPDPPGSWSNYARAAAQALARRLDRPIIGLDGLLWGAPPFGVPRGAGLSSSSALTVVTAVALACFNDWQPEGAELARFCADAEWYVGTRGGIMDHFISVLGRRDHAMFLDCRPRGDSYTTAHVLLPQDYRLLVEDSGVHHENARGQFNLRVAACRAGVGLLQRTYRGITHLRDVQDVAWDELAPQLPEETTAGELARVGVVLGDLPGLDADTPLRVRARCRHVWSENLRVLQAVAALRAGDVPVLGRLLDAAHASARDDYEVSCAELDGLVQAAREVQGVHGARLTGAGWGGCIVALVAAPVVADFEAHVSRRYRSEFGRSPNVFACQAGPGAGRVTL